MKRFDKKLNAQDILTLFPAASQSIKFPTSLKRFTILTAYPLFPAIAAMNMTCS